MPQLTDQKLLEAINAAKVTAKFINSDYDAKDISLEQFAIIHEELENKKITEFELTLDNIDDKSLEILGSIFKTHAELQGIVINCYQATPQQIEKFASIIPPGCKEICLQFFQLAETNIQMILYSIDQLPNIEAVELVGGDEKFGHNLKLVDLYINQTLSKCLNLKKFSIVHCIEECKNSEIWEKYSARIQIFLDVRNKSKEFFDVGNLSDFETIILHLKQQLLSVTKLLQPTDLYIHPENYVYKASEKVFFFYLDYLASSSFFYKHLIQVINCFVNLFAQLSKEKNLKVYSTLAECLLRAEIEETSAAINKLAEKKIGALTLYLQYLLCAETLKDPAYNPQAFNTKLVNLLNDLSNRGLVKDQTINDFFNLYPEEFRDILAAVADCMHKYNLPAEAEYEIIDEDNVQSLMSGLTSKNGREQLSKRKLNKNLQASQQENNSLKETIVNLKLLKAKRTHFFLNASDQTQEDPDPSRAKFSRLL